jgi:hypothetical protein
MPTPSPTSAPRVGANPATLITWLSRLTVSSPPPTPAAAVKIGSSIEKREPKARKSTIAAAPMPTASLSSAGLCSAFSTAVPPTSTSSPGEATACASAISRFAPAPLSEEPASLSCSVAYAVFPSALI